MKRAIALIALIWSVAASAQDVPNAPAEQKPLPALPERYQTIVDRQMFGPLPPNFDPLKPASTITRADERAAAEAAEQLSMEQEKLKSAVTFSMINLKQDGTVMVGFTDACDSKKIRNYYLKVGETRDGWTVKEADPLKATMTIERDGVEISLSLGGDSSKDDSANRRVGGAAGALSSKVTPTPRNPLADGGSLRERREQRRLLRQQQEEAKFNKMKEDFAKQQKEQAEKLAEEKQKADEKQQAMQQQLLNLAEQIKKNREPQRKKPEDGEDGAEE